MQSGDNRGAIVWRLGISSLARVQALGATRESECRPLWVCEPRTQCRLWVSWLVGSRECDSGRASHARSVACVGRLCLPKKSQSARVDGFGAFGGSRVLDACAGLVEEIKGP